MESQAHDDIEGGVGLSVAAPIEAVPASLIPDGTGRRRLLNESGPGCRRAAVWAPTPKLARSVGDVSVVSRSRCRSCVAISSARVKSIEWAWTESGAACEQTAIGEVVAQRSRCAHNNLLQGDHRHGARLHRRIPRDFELADHLDGTVAVFGIAVDWPANTDRAATSASMVSDSSGAPRTSVTPIHFYDPMPRSAHRAGQAGTIAPSMPNASIGPCISAHVIRA